MYETEECEVVVSGKSNSFICSYCFNGIMYETEECQVP
jgi:hypothetical protein